MSRAAVFDALVNSAALNDLGIDENSVFHNYNLEQRPISYAGPFVILRWETSDPPVFRDSDAGDVKSPMRLTIWANYPVEMTNDFARLDNVLDLCDSALAGLRDTEGTDGYTVTHVRAMGRSSDLQDDGFQTITKNSGYEVLARRSKESV